MNGRAAPALPPSGEQVEIAWEDQRATVVEVGGGIRRYDVGDRAVLDPYPVDAMADGGHGAVLAPWPNRLADGAYRFDGIDCQLALSEPEKGNAIHGLLRWRPWRVVDRAADRVRMGIRLFPMKGYPFLLDVEVEYALGASGLTVATTAANPAPIACPYGSGHHPYLSAGPGTVDQCTLELAAATRIVSDPERGLPVGTEATSGTDHDFRAPSRLGDRQLDLTFTDLERDADGRAWARLARPDGATSELWADDGYPYLQVYTGDSLAPGRRRQGLAVEPMTCPPNAFRSGDALVRLEPGRSATTTWGVRLT